MLREVPIRNLEQIHYAALEGSQKPDLCHVYGIFRKEERKGATLVWYLFDEYKEVAIELCGKIEEYPRPKPGDVVRIHRLRINARKKRPEITLGRNVVYWPSFQYNPKPVTTAKSPTITEEDTLRRRVLETLFSSTITRCSDILKFSESDNYVWFQAIAGRVETNQLDMYGHHEIKFVDGSELPAKLGQSRSQPTLRVFMPKEPDECDGHYKMAETLRPGQYFIATNLKLARNYHLNLSANDQHGRSFRLVEEASILGVRLKESLSSTEPDQEAGTSTGSTLQVRRSPRLNSQNADGIPTAAQSSKKPANSLTAVQETVNRPKEEEHPKFQRFSEIRPKTVGYEFYNLIGQVRDKPRITKQYGNCVLQLFDGSKHEHASYYDTEVDQIIDGCLVLYIYSKQAERDTNEHFERAMNLEPGDIVYVKNVKVSLRDGRLRLELQANKLHNKSINPVDVSSAFGRRILDIVQTPQVEEIMTDGTSDSSQEAGL